MAGINNPDEKAQIGPKWKPIQKIRYLKPDSKWKILQWVEDWIKFLRHEISLAIYNSEKSSKMWETFSINNNLKIVKKKNSKWGTSLFQEIIYSIRQF